MYKVFINKGKEKQLVKHHPWVFTGAIEKVEPKYSNADWAAAYTYDGKFIANGYYDEKSSVVLRLFNYDRKFNQESYIKNAIYSSLQRRKELLALNDTNCLRLIHSDADYLPGLVVDLYAKELKVIISSRFAHANRDLILNILKEFLSPNTINIRTDNQYAKAESLSNYDITYDKDLNVVKDLKDNILFVESGIYYESERTHSQKSGFYCDQRDNRKLVASYAKDKKVLDACSYTGAFTLHALKNGAKEVTALDSSESSLRHLLYQVHLNVNKGVLPEGSREKVTTVNADVFNHIREFEDSSYDLIILDPPKLAQTKNKLENALKAYKDLNRVAMMKVKNNGIIATFSCSSALSLAEFKTMVAYAAADLKYEVQVLNVMSAGSDHPYRLSFSESEYLKGLIIRVIK